MFRFAFWALIACIEVLKVLFVAILFFIACSVLYPRPVALFWILLDLDERWNAAIASCREAISASIRFALLPDASCPIAYKVGRSMAFNGSVMLGFIA